MARIGVIRGGMLTLCVACCAASHADRPLSLAEAKLRIAREVSDRLRVTPLPVKQGPVELPPLTSRSDSQVTSRPESKHGGRSAVPPGSGTTSANGQNVPPASRKLFTVVAGNPRGNVRLAGSTRRDETGVGVRRAVYTPASDERVEKGKLRLVADSESILIPAPIQDLTPAEQPRDRRLRQTLTQNDGGARNLGPESFTRDDEPVLIPIADNPEPDPNHIQLQGDRGLVTLIANGAQLVDVLRMIADHHGLNLVLGPNVEGPVTVSIRSAHFEDVLDAILGVAGFSWHRVDNLLYVTELYAEGEPAKGMDPRVQGRRVQVYTLNYVSATDIEAVANRLISPVGNVFISESDSADQLKTRELLVVEDVEAAHRRIAEYISQVDMPPRQVLVEAHVLQISLGEEERHGINLKSLARVGGGQISIEGKNFADDGNADPALVLRVEGKDMTSLIELIRSQTNSRTLASPKLSVVNRQEAKIQIGQRLPYSVATTTQTTTVQSVEFLEVGIVLTVQPVITGDGNVLMTVLPKVSGGKITESGFPEEDTTEVQTTILLPDGGGVILGGLIREDNLHHRSIVPGFGRIPVLGRLFRKRSDECRRNELIVALVTHVMPEACGPRHHEMHELEQALPPYAATELRHPQLPLMLDP